MIRVATRLLKATALLTLVFAVAYAIWWAVPRYPLVTAVVIGSILLFILYTCID